jgi:hypothetical protein
MGKSRMPLRLTQMGYDDYTTQLKSMECCSDAQITAPSLKQSPEHHYQPIEQETSHE